MKAGNGSANDYEDEQIERPVKKSNCLPNWGNEKTMNLNPLILTNIQSSQYFKVNLYQLKTYHEVIDEIYYQVSHLEPWEKGSRKTSGQTGMCGGVRGVGAGGIVSTAFCILYKLYTLKLTRKQLLGLINHADSPYIRGLGFMFIRFTQPPADLWDWFEGYLDDEEEIDVRAGGGQPTTMGTVVRHMLTKLDWHSTLFPRIPVPIQKDIEKKLAERAAIRPLPSNENYSNSRENDFEKNNDRNGDYKKGRATEFERDDRGRDSSDRREKYGKERGRDLDTHRDADRLKNRDRSKDRTRDRSRERDRHRHKRERSRDRHHHKHSGRHHSDFDKELEREKERLRKERRRSRSNSRSKDRDRKRRDR